MTAEDNIKKLERMIYTTQDEVHSINIKLEQCKASMQSIYWMWNDKLKEIEIATDTKVVERGTIAHVDLGEVHCMRCGALIEYDDYQMYDVSSKDNVHMHRITVCKACADELSENYKKTKLEYKIECSNEMCSNDIIDGEIVLYTTLEGTPFYYEYCSHACRLEYEAMMKGKILPYRIDKVKDDEN